jgi:hypothetical protein
LPVPQGAECRFIVCQAQIVFFPTCGIYDEDRAPLRGGDQLFDPHRGGIDIQISCCSGDYDIDFATVEIIHQALEVFATLPDPFNKGVAMQPRFRIDNVYDGSLFGRICRHRGASMLRERSLWYFPELEYTNARSVDFIR